MRIREHPLYNTYRGMRERCNNPNFWAYARYGGRGIKVCERWDSFWLFVADMGVKPEGHTLDRKDNDGNYEPNNCRWATWSEQQQNRSMPTTNKLKIMGVSKHAKTDGYIARINGKYLGYYNTPELAAAAVADSRKSTRVYLKTLKEDSNAPREPLGQKQTN